ncbi:MAG TPA: LON peptidase substrate-binding domain-containing protein, partial [Candidatus Sumerlaeota bacterium]|nr:LON peptidase substrate-binding domain-containing protein [Candidatus Sumerlaeota bacterium]
MSSLLLPIIPLKEIVVFPNSITPLFIVRHRSLQALEGALAQDKAVFLVTQKNVEEEHPGLEDLYEVGCVAGIVQVLRLPDGSAKILVEGRYPARIVRATSEPSYMTALVEEIHAVEERGKEIEALRRTVEKQFETYVQLSDKVPEDLAVSIRSLDDAVPLANAITNYCHFRASDKQRVLEARRASEKLLILSQLFTAENELLELENKIITQVKAKIGKSQKEYFLNEQLKIIEKELGVGGEEDVELEEYDERLKKSKMSEEAREKAYRELNRLARMAQLSPEATVSRTYIEWLLDLPWGKYTKDQEDLERAQKILDEDHFGLVKVKERIVEHLAVLKLVKEMKGPILCLVGPPGVGKTSLARS